MIRQKLDIDHFDKYAPAARITTIRLLVALATLYHLEIHQMDVKTAFLYGDSYEKVYMKQTEGFILEGQEKKVCKLVKSLYGIKQTPKQWHQKFDEIILSFGFKLNQADKCSYSKFDSYGNRVIICLYVDGILVQVQETKDFLSRSFQMKDMGEANVILGIEIIRQGNRIKLSQSHSVENILKRFSTLDKVPISNPMKLGMKFAKHTGSSLKYLKVIGSLMYAMTCIRPDIAFAIGKPSRSTSKPGPPSLDGDKESIKILIAYQGL